MTIAQTIKGFFHSPRIDKVDVKKPDLTMQMLQRVSREATYALINAVRETISFKFAPEGAVFKEEYLQVNFPFGNDEINMPTNEYVKRHVVPVVATLAERFKEKKKQEIKTYDLAFLCSVEYQYMCKMAGLSAFFYIWFNPYKDQPQIVMTVAI